jgi:hypothetical protein
MEKDLEQMNAQINVLSPEERYILQQYTHHGDVIINAFMRGRDDVETYTLNMYDPYRDDESEARAFFCLFLLEIDPDALQDESHFDDGIRQWDGTSLLVNEKFMKYYKYRIFPQFQNKTPKATIIMFRRMTANIVVKLGNILAKRPPFSKIFMTYRGAKDKYLEERADAKILGSYNSTTIDYFVAQDFGDIVYKFCIYPGCIWMYVEPLTVHTNEKEVLLGPGNRFVVLPEHVRKEIRKSENLFLILPPKISDAKNSTILNNFIRNLRKYRGVDDAAKGAAAAGGGGGGGNNVQKVLNTLAKNTEYEKILENFYAGAAGGGAGKQRRGGTRTQKQKRSSTRRRRQTRKQRGGTSIVMLDPMNRWAVDPIFVRAEDLSEDDLEKVAEMLATLKE